MGSDGTVRVDTSGEGEPERGAGAGGGTATPDGEGSSVRRGRNLGDGEDPMARHDRDLRDVWEVLLSIRETVENDHAHRLRRIETDLRWVIMLLAGLIIALVGAALSGVFGG